MREIVLDTETTGFDPLTGDRVVEIGCVELINHIPSGQTFHRYINPERDMPAGAFAVHGLSEEFLRQHPVFAQVVEDLLAFIGGDPIIAHNARFDMGFLNAEFSRAGLAPLPMERAIDTVGLARKKFPGAQASLDALCRRFGIDNSARTKHGALLDAELLAEVYLELIGGRQPDFALAVDQVAVSATLVAGQAAVRPARAHAPSTAELEAHAAFLKRLKEPIWLN